MAGRLPGILLSWKVVRWPCRILQEAMAMRFEGEKVKSRFTGKPYRIKKIDGRMVVLEAENGTSQVITEMGNLKLFYEKEEKKDEGG